MNILVIIPTFNEANSILELLNRLQKVSVFLKNQFNVSILIVDGGSDDNTVELALSRGSGEVRVINEGAKRGIGPAYIQGFKYGLELNFDYFIQMDADLSHQPEQIPHLLESANHNTLVIGTRWMDGGSVENWPYVRRFISKLGTSYASKMLSLGFRDLTSGFRVLPKELVKTLNLESITSRGYGFQIEIALQTIDLGFQIKEVPITFVERVGGKTKMSLFIVFEAWKMVSIKAFRRIIYRR
jgi:dolichol-phosphate mannosyltransferase